MARTVTEKCIVDAAASTARTLGYEKMKDHQLQVVTGILKGHDVFAALPTGYGKSLCFASLPMLFDKVLPLKEPSIVIVVETALYVCTYLLRTNVAPAVTYNYWNVLWLCNTALSAHSNLTSA